MQENCISAASKICEYATPEILTTSPSGWPRARQHGVSGAATSCKAQILLKEYKLQIVVH
eukprot:6193464-Pleurochrysis_carterae.AAC.6